MKDKDQNYYGKVPAGVDVRRLIDRYGELKIGDIVAYSDIEKLIGVDRRSNRFYYVTTEWRRLMENKGVVLDCVHGEAFRVANFAEVMCKPYDAIRVAGNKLRNVARKVDAVRPETAQEEAEAGHARRVLLSTVKHLSHSMKRLAAPPASNVLPMRKPPVEGLDRHEPVGSSPVAN